MYVPRGGLFDDPHPKRTITSPFGELRVSAPDPSPDGTSLAFPRAPQKTTV